MEHGSRRNRYPPKVSMENVHGWKNEKERGESSEKIDGKITPFFSCLSKILPLERYACPQRSYERIRWWVNSMCVCVYEGKKGNLKWLYYSDGLLNDLMLIVMGSIISCPSTPICRNHERKCYYTLGVRSTSFPFHSLLSSNRSHLFLAWYLNWVDRMKAEPPCSTRETSAMVAMGCWRQIGKMRCLSSAIGEEKPRCKTKGSMIMNWWIVKGSKQAGGNELKKRKPTLSSTAFHFCIVYMYLFRFVACASMPLPNPHGTLMKLCNILRRAKCCCMAPAVDQIINKHIRRRKRKYCARQQNLRENPIPLPWEKRGKVSLF